MLKLIHYIYSRLDFYSSITSVAFTSVKPIRLSKNFTPEYYRKEIWYFLCDVHSAQDAHAPASLLWTRLYKRWLCNHVQYMVHMACVTCVEHLYLCTQCRYHAVSRKTIIFDRISPHLQILILMILVQNLIRSVLLCNISEAIHWLSVLCLSNLCKTTDF